MTCMLHTKTDGTFDIEGFPEIPHEPFDVDEVGAWGIRTHKQLYFCGMCGGYLVKTTVSLAGNVTSEEIEFAGWNKNEIR